MRPLGCLYLIKLLLKLLSLNLAFVAIRDRSLFVISMVVHVTLDVFVVVICKLESDKSAGVSFWLRGVSLLSQFLDLKVSTHRVRLSRLDS